MKRAAARFHRKLLLALTVAAPCQSWLDQGSRSDRT